MNWFEVDNLLAFLFWMVLCGFFYWRGLIAGYNTKRREKTSRVVNVEIIAVDGAYLFYNMEDNKFLFQTRTADEGKDRLQKDLEENQVLMYIMVDEHGKPV